MLICRHNANLQPNTDSHNDVDWTQSAQAYPNLEELPTFITRQRQTAAEHSVPLLTLSICKGSNY